MASLRKVSLVATTAMTFFSYCVSINSEHKFLEPQLLNELIFPAHKEAMKHNITGYLSHWLMGAFFSAGYRFLWRHELVKHDYPTAGILGFFNGLLGICGWHATFSIHKNPPKTHLKKYYLQLLAAHVVFGLFNRVV